jgi:hypothetical protein
VTSSSIRSGSSTPRENALAAEATFNQLRDMPDASATFISVDVCDYRVCLGRLPETHRLPSSGIETLSKSADH